LLGKRKLGSAIGALALIGGFMGAAIGTSVITATAASAQPTGPYNCTVSDADNAAVPPVVANGLSFPATVPAGTLGVPGNAAESVLPGDNINFSCTGLEADEGVAIVQAAALAGFDNPVSEQSYADLADGNTGGSADDGGNFNANLSSTYTNTHDTNVTCPGTQNAANIGAGLCIVTAADISTQTPLILVSVAYTTDVAPQDPALSITAVGSSQNFVVPEGTPATFTPVTTSGSWYGAGPDGAGTEECAPLWTVNPAYTGVADHTHPQLINTGCDSSAPTVPINAVVSGPSSVVADATGLGVKPASYCFHGVLPASCVTGGTPGSYLPTPPLVLDGSVSVPAINTPGLYHLTVIEAAGPQATFDFWVAGGTATATQVGTGSIGPNTGVTLTGSGWSPDASPTFTATWNGPGGTCTTHNGPYAAGSLVVTSPSSGAPTFSLNTGDIPAAAFNDPLCIPGGWTVDITESVNDPITAASSSTALNLVNLASSCDILTTGNCLVQQGLSQVVKGTQLTVTEDAATSGIGAPAVPPSAILVNLSLVTLGPGVFQSGQGELNTVEVNDSRGSLSGWTVTGILEKDFSGPVAGANIEDNTIPADYLTWNPSVSLTFPGNLQSGVVPFGTVRPPAYGPDACVAGAPATGSNTNILCPAVNDNAGSPNLPGSTQIGGTGPGTPNHPISTPWPSTNAEGPSGLLDEVEAGQISTMETADSGASDYHGGSAVTLCDAPPGGGGGSFNCDASLSLAVPPYVAAGTYTATMDLLTTAT
jgi:hypothetical protein